MKVESSSSKNRFLVPVLALIFLSSFGLLSHNTFADTVTATIPVGGTPEGIAVNPNTNMVYVGDTSNGIDVINGATNNIVASVNAGGNVVTVNPSTNMIYTATGYTIYVINGSTNQVVKTGWADFTAINDMKINPVTNKIYAVGYSYACNPNCGPTGNLDVINATTMQITQSMIVNRNTVEDVAIDVDTNKVYLSDGNIYVLDGATGAITGQISGSTSALQMAINPSTSRLYASYLGHDALAIVDLTANNVIGTVPVGSAPLPVDVNTKTNMIYTGLYSANGGVTAVNGSTNSPLVTLATGTYTMGVAVNPNTNRIYATNQQSGTVSVIDGSSSSGTTNTLTAPSAPQNLATTAGNAQVSLSWTTPSSNGGSPITNYNIYRGTSSGSETLLATVGNANSYNDNTVTNGQTYFYKVTAVNSIGESPQSNEANATPAAPATVSSAPTGLTATTVSSSQINLSWTAPSNNGGSAVTGYMIQRSTDGGATWSNIVSNSGSTSTTYSDTGLASSTTYSYQVSAINSVGTSPPSNTASATTSGITIASGIVLNNVQSTSGTTSSSNQMTLSGFNAGTGSNQLLLVGISANNNSPVYVTFNGMPLTQAVGSFYNNDAEFWYLKNPSGTGNIVVTMGGPTQAVVGAYSFSGVNQADPLPTNVARHNTTPNSPNISITTKYANDMVLDLPSIWGGVTLGSPTCTQQWDVNVPNAITGASSSTTVQSPASVACKWTASSADFWDDVAVELRAN